MDRLWHTISTYSERGIHKNSDNNIFSSKNILDQSRIQLMIRFNFFKDGFFFSNQDARMLIKL